MTKKLFCVETREVWIQPVYILAESHNDARRRVQDGEGAQHQNGFELSHVTNPEYGWPANEVQDEGTIKFFTKLLRLREDEIDQPDAAQ